jgi:hypothetical protein
VRANHPKIYSYKIKIKKQEEKEKEEEVVRKSGPIDPW